MKNIFLIVLSSVMLMGCGQLGSERIKGNGVVKTETRSISDFNEISVTGAFNVNIFCSSNDNVTIETDENLMKLVETIVKDDELIIRFNKEYNVTNYTVLNVKVPYNSLKEIEVTGSGEVTSKDVVKEDKLELSVTGSGDILLELLVEYLAAEVTGSGAIHLKGKVQEAEFEVTGSGDIRAKELNVDVAEASVTGSGDIYLSVKKDLDADVTGSGDINYYGKPDKLKTKVLGSGDINER